MKIAVDAMGGDFGPEITIRDAVRLAKDFVVNHVQERIQQAIAEAAQATGGVKA
jgi:fatty acid/phospholipid biosynthesis enzyme